MDLWNQKDLKGPPINTFKSNNCNVDLPRLKKTVQKSYEFYSNEELLHNEAALLSRCIYRMKMKFRNSKDFKTLEKINKVLLHYLEVDIAPVLRNFLELIPTNSKILPIYLPTKDVLDFILVKLQSVAKLMSRLVESTKLGIGCLQSRIAQGQFWNIAILEFGLLSRLHVLAKRILIHTCNFYNVVHPYSKKLKNNNNVWLPAGYKFPTNLRKWINCDWIFEEQLSKAVEKKSRQQSNIIYAEDSDGDIPE